MAARIGVNAAYGRKLRGMRAGPLRDGDAILRRHAPGFETIARVDRVKW